MKIRSLPLTVVAFSVALASSAAAIAQTPDDYVKSQHTKLEGLLRQPDSSTKDTQISATLDSMIDYDALVKRTFGEPCPVAGCTDHWTHDLSADQRIEISGLIKTLVQKNYKKNLNRTLNYAINYTGSGNVGSDIQVHTEAKSKTDTREPSVFIDYVLENAAGSYRVIDIVTERSSLVKNYYDAFHKYLTTPGQGYPYLKQKVVDKTSKL